MNNIALYEGPYKGGRNRKLSQKWLDEAKVVLFDGVNSLILTDEELLQLVNIRVAPETRISIDTFKRYKKEVETKPIEELEPDLYEFCTLYNEARIRQKKGLFNKVLTNVTGWQRFAWIIERKFDPWNKTKQDKRDEIDPKKDEAPVESLTDEQKQKIAERYLNKQNLDEGNK